MGICEPNLAPLKKSHVSEELMLFRSRANENTPAYCRGQIVSGSPRRWI